MSKLSTEPLSLSTPTASLSQGDSSSHIINVEEGGSDIADEKVLSASPARQRSAFRKIDAIRFSSNHNYAVTYTSELNGILTVWKISPNSIKVYYECTDDPSLTVMNSDWDIYLDVSPDGRYIAASTFVVKKSTPPSMKLYHNKKLEKYKPPPHMEGLRGHGVFGPADEKTFILCTDRWPWPHIHARIVIYDIENEWTIIKQLKTGYDFTWPIRWPINLPPSHSIRLVATEKTNVSKLFPRGARDFIANGGGLAHAISQNSLILRSSSDSSDDKRPEYYLQSWSIMTGNPQQSMDLRFLSDTIPIISDNGLYKAVRTKLPKNEDEFEPAESNPRYIRVFSSITGCELAVSNLEFDDEKEPNDADDWQPVRFVGIANQVLIIRNQHGDVRLWRFMVESEQPITVAKELERYVDHDHPTKPKRMNSMITSAPSDSVTFVVATTILQRPAIFRIITKADTLDIEHVIVPAILTNEFSQVEKRTIYTRSHKRLFKAKDAEDHEYVEYDIEPWITNEEYKGWFSNLGNTDGSRYLVVGRSTVQLYSNHEENGKPMTKLEFIWTIPIGAKKITSVEISNDYSELRIRYILDKEEPIQYYNPSNPKLPRNSFATSSEDGVQIDLDGLKEVINGKLVDSEIQRVEIIQIPQQIENDGDSFYISSNLLNSLRFLMEVKMEYSWRISSPFCYQIMDYARIYLNEQPRMLFDTIQQFAIRAYWSAKAINMAGTAHRRLNEELNSLIEVLTNSNEYIPTIEHNIGKDLLSTAIKKRNTKLVLKLVKYFTTRAIQDNIGFMVPITGSFKSLLKHYPDEAFNALKMTCFIKVGDEFTGSEEDFLTVPTYGRFQTREYILLGDAIRIISGVIILSIMFPLSLPTIVLPSLILLTPVYLKYKERRDEFYLERHDKIPPKYHDGHFPNFIEWIKLSLHHVWVDLYPSSWLDRKIGKLKLLLWQPDHDRQKFIFPLPNLSVYYKEESKIDDWFFPSSPFTEICDADNAELFGLPIWKGVIEFKWRAFARSRYYFLWAMHCVVLIIFALTTTPSMTDTVYTGSYSSLYVLIIFSLFFLLNELRQAIYYTWRYFLSPYNYVDVITFVLVLWCAIPMLNSNTPIPVTRNSVTMLLLWIRFLFQTRIYRPIGIFVNVIIDVVIGLIPFMFVLAITLVGFSHALWILIGSDPKISPNYFTTYQSSMKYAFLALTGDPTGLSSIDRENVFSDIYRAFYSVFTVIILLNILIALLNNRYEAAYERSRDVYTLQMAQIIAEIEIFYMLPWERLNAFKFPRDLTYEVEVDNIKVYKAKLEIEGEVSKDTDTSTTDKIEAMMRLFSEKMQAETTVSPDEKGKVVATKSISPVMASKVSKLASDSSRKISIKAEALERHVEHLEDEINERNQKIEELTLKNKKLQEEVDNWEREIMNL